MIRKLDEGALIARSLEGTQFMPGCVGLNNLKLTSFANSVIQLLARVKPLRNFCLIEEESDPSQLQNDPRAMLSLRFSQLIKKLWNPFNFKGHVSAHEFMEAVSIASQKRFRSDDQTMKEKGFGGQADPLQFLAWLMNSLKAHKKTVERTFQGELQVTKLVK